ncbi:MAG: DedA family protein, partial [Thermomicrobiales bacterium]
TTLLFLAMRTGGNTIARRILRRLHKDENASIDRWRARLESHQSRVVFAVRLLPLVRMYIAITTGLMRIRARAYVIGAAPAAAIWVGLPVALGFVLRANVQELQARYSIISHIVVLLSPMAGAIGAIVWWIRSAASRTDRIRRVRLVTGFSTAIAGAGYLATSSWALDRANDRGQSLVDPARMEPWMFALAASVVVLLISGAGDLRLRSAGIGSLGSEASARFTAIGGWRTVTTAATVTIVIGLLITLEHQFGLL